MQDLSIAYPYQQFIEVIYLYSDMESVPFTFFRHYYEILLAGRLISYFWSLFHTRKDWKIKCWRRTFSEVLFTIYFGIFAFWLNFSLLHCNEDLNLLVWYWPVQRIFFSSISFQANVVDLGSPSCLIEGSISFKCRVKLLFKIWCAWVKITRIKSRAPSTFELVLIGFSLFMLLR